MNHLFNSGIRPAIYIGKVDYANEYDKLDEMYEKLNKNKYVVKYSASSWYQSFKTWLGTTQNGTKWTNEAEFYSNLTKFLDTAGRKFKADVKFDRYSTIKVNILVTCFPMD